MTDELRSLASSCGVELQYHDVFGTQHHASDEALVAVLRAMGLAVETRGDAGELARAMAADRPMVEPVTAALAGLEQDVEIRVRSTDASAVRVVVELEGGVDGGECERTPERDVPAGDDVSAVVRLPPLPPGYHRLHATAANHSASGIIVCAPPSAPRPPRKTWGVFAPWYALHDAHTGEVAGLRELTRLREAIRRFGGEYVATLPLYAQFYGDPFEPSPYAPASRLFFNELLVSEPDERPASAARAGTRGRRAYVDYRRAFEAARPRLTALAQAAFAGGEPAEIASFRASDPELDGYARFRAASEAGGPWRSWSRPPDPDPSGVRDHVFAQWLVSRGLDELGRDGLYLDLPVGVHPDSYDTYRFPDAFALDARAGAPPDTFFRSGQDWGFPPPHPTAARLDGYAYFREVLARVMRRAAVLRIDHVMGLHRLFWIPEGFAAADGVYVRYPADELFAVVLLEAERAGTVLVGEDLGTVPDEVRERLERTSIHRCYVLPFETEEHEGGEPRPVPRGSFASLNTHDMPPFAAWWRESRAQPVGRFLEAAVDDTDAGDTDGDGRHGGDAEARARQAGDAPVPAERAVGAALRFLGKSGARSVVVSLEDLWGETRPQNVPGIVDDANWSRRTAWSLEDFEADPHAAATLMGLDDVRRESE